VKNSILITKSLTSTAVACTVFVRGIGYCDATLRRQHHTGYIVLALPWREFDIDSGETRYSESGVAVTELVSDKGIRFYAQSAAGDVWQAIHGMPPMIASPEVESISIHHQAIA
jgi:hypothetical protein